MAEMAFDVDQSAAACALAPDAYSAFGLYVHWPFCLAKCPYCDFNSHVSRGEIAQDRFRDAYLKELAHFAALAPGRRVASVFFGGGTPSLMAPETVAAILDAAAGHWGFTDDPEITLEANPTSVEAARFAGYRAAGVNRLSLGIQALNDADLAALGRQHSAKEALGALETAKAHFGRVSFDLIYGREGQSLEAWSAELAQALQLAADHLSVYQLTVEPDTPFAARYRAGKLKLPPQGVGQALYDLTQVLCEAAGMPAYEISNHARPGSESRHNLIYWRGQDYAGIGPGAHSRITLGGARHALVATRAPEAWARQVVADGHGLCADEVLEPEEAADEMLLMGLRLAEGVDLERIEAWRGAPFDQKRLAALEADGLIRRQGSRIAASREGRVVLDRLILELAA